MTSSSAPGRRILVKGALVGAALLFGAAPAPAAARDAAPLLRLRLPAPGGPYPVRADTQYLADPSRNDPWDREIGVRELMVTVLRPAGPGHRFPRAPQMTPGAAASFTDLAHWIHQPLPRTGVDWAATLTHARTGARPRPVRGRPVLLYSPGGGDARTMGSSLAVDLASYGWTVLTVDHPGDGWTVLTVDHPGDASEVEFPDERPNRERVRETVLLGPPDAATFRTMIDTRVADLRLARHLPK
ncbi:hypothetical protein ACPEIC_43685 [Stenotrophomonas sp. NPDC087984]